MKNRTLTKNSQRWLTKHRAAQRAVKAERYADYNDAIEVLKTKLAEVDITPEYRISEAPGFDIVCVIWENPNKSKASAWLWQGDAEISLFRESYYNIQTLTELEAMKVPAEIDIKFSANDELPDFFDTLYTTKEDNNGN